jgi:hypothetical protein
VAASEGAGRVDVVDVVDVVVVVDVVDVEDGPEVVEGGGAGGSEVTVVTGSFVEEISGGPPDAGLAETMTGELVGGLLEVDWGPVLPAPPAGAIPSRAATNSTSSSVMPRAQMPTPRMP